MQNLLVFAQAGDASAQPSPFLQFLPLIFLFVIFYFMLIRPQQKKQKEHANMISSVDKNDEIVTAGGIHGTVVATGDKTISVRIADNVKIELEKSSISQVTKKRA